MTSSHGIRKRMNTVFKPGTTNHVVTQLTVTMPVIINYKNLRAVQARDCAYTLCEVHEEVHVLGKGTSRSVRGSDYVSGTRKERELTVQMAVN